MFCQAVSAALGFHLFLPKIPGISKKLERRGAVGQGRGAVGQLGHTKDLVMEIEVWKTSKQLVVKDKKHALLFYLDIWPCSCQDVVPVALIPGVTGQCCLGAVR